LSTFQDVGELLVVVVVQRHVAAFLDEHPGDHDLLPVHHFAVDQRVQVLALDVLPGDVFRCGAGGHGAPP
jgi:hypothetical protein